jgi:hypothetical protein
VIDQFIPIVLLTSASNSPLRHLLCITVNLTAGCHTQPPQQHARVISLLPTLPEVIPNDKGSHAHIPNKPECFERYSQFLLSLVGPAPTTHSPQNNTEPASSTVGSSPFPIQFSPQDPVGGLDALVLDGAFTASEPERPWVGVHPGMQEPPTNDEREYVEVYPHSGKILCRDQSTYEKFSPTSSEKYILSLCVSVRMGPGSFSTQ